MTKGEDGGRSSAQGPDEPDSSTGHPDTPPRPSGDGGGEGTVGRRQLLIGGGAAFGVWYLFIRDDSDGERNDPAVGSAGDDDSGDGYGDPEAAVVAFVERVQDGEDDAATELLYQDEYENARDLLGNWYEDYSEGEFVNMETNVRSEDPDRVEIEFLYNDNNHHDPEYGFGSLFYLQETSRGWVISDFDGSHMGEAWG